MRSLSIAIGLTLTIVLPSNSANAAEPLTLEQALELARRQSETPAIALARLERAQALRRQALAALVPALTLSGSYTRRAREVTRTIDDEVLTVQAIDALSSQAVAEATLFDLRALPLLRAATFGVAAQESDSQELERLLAFDVAAAFFEVLSAESLRGAAQERVQVAEATLREARIRREAGLADRNNVTRTELELATANLGATRAAGLVTTTRLALSFLVGEKIADRALARPSEPTPPIDSPEQLIARALGARREIAALEDRLAQARQLALAPRYAALPRFDLRGLYRWTNEAGLSGREEDWNVAVGLTWELFDGGERSAIAAQRDAEARETELTLARTRRAVELEVLQALADLRASTAALAAAGVRRDVARANADEVHERFVHGLASALEQADALVGRFEAEAEQVRQGYAGSSARLELLRALGDRPVAGVPASAVASEPTESNR